LSPTFLPGIFVADDSMAVLLLGLVVGLAAGVFEELGWTGFAIPRLKQRYYGFLTTGLIVGAVLVLLVWGFVGRGRSAPGRSVASLGIGRYLSHGEASGGSIDHQHRVSMRLSEKGKPDLFDKRLSRVAALGIASRPPSN